MMDTSAQSDILQQAESPPAALRACPRPHTFDGHTFHFFVGRSRHFGQRPSVPPSSRMIVIESHDSARLSAGSWPIIVRADAHGPVWRDAERCSAVRCGEWKRGGHYGDLDGRAARTRSACSCTWTATARSHTAGKEIRRAQAQRDPLHLARIRRPCRVRARAADRAGADRDGLGGAQPDGDGRSTPGLPSRLVTWTEWVERHAGMVGVRRSCAERYGK